MADRVIRTEDAIAEVLGCSRSTVVRLARRPVDPLRLWSSDYDRTPWALESRLVWYRRRWKTPDDPEIPRAADWPAIAAKLGVCTKTARALALRPHDPLPVRWTAGGRREAFEHALLDWVDARNRLHVDLMAGLRAPGRAA